MKIAAISDVHVKTPHDEADKLLSAFLDHPEVQSADYVLLLGDIFDLMCGPHEEYIKLYSHLFDRMDALHKKGKKVFFLEGNHDVHLQGLFLKRWPNFEILSEQTPVIEKIDGKLYYFSHGDEHEVDNEAYQRYKEIIHSAPLRFVANQIMPYAVLNYVGEKASKISRKKGSRKFDAELVRNRFRNGVQTTTKGEFDFVIGGHSHVKDNYTLPGSNSVYLNNGYALRENTFLLIDNHVPKFITFASGSTSASGGQA
ncbi:UDP-2,3-diacylglucosamine diphosphatase [Peredibacter starrii]|uniref:UDP-2,3-diacylglucosamine diphosphatase n=1 Tax=Peredibacter starrii TaxID=28202 RepID=A0AAX4HQN7_9BACT|nr:UDP-2,3-diacylglucosamine diphosphatase [Peredibacter starrii]WPU65498.1 UDP-2,3-diacylglucosamine diphosphatase [Peredibacter starrii]